MRNPVFLYYFLHYSGILTALTHRRLLVDYFIYFQHIADNILMSFFRFSDNPVNGYFLGTAILSTICVAVGELSIYLAFRFNKDKIDHTNNDMEHYQHLSIKALKAGNKDAFRACNSIANESIRVI